ncbi:MAG: phage recombination protein Bet [Proteobacteria bacterium]|nr:phage recombination protein Bet [Pseudomonadota bacterium]
MSKELATETKKSVIDFMAGKYGMERAAFEAVIKETVMAGNVKNEEFVAFLSVAKEYDLNPLTKEIYAFAKGGRVIPIVPVDGWSTIINRRPEMDGVEFNDVVENGKLISIECRIYRKDRSRPICATEYLEECNVESSPAWKKWPRRMLRHKALIQAARYAFGLGGIYDPDEGERIKEAIVDVTPKSKTANAHIPPAAIEKSFNVSDLKASVVSDHIEETLEMIQNQEPEAQIEMFEGEIVTNNDEVAEQAFKRVSGMLPSLVAAKGVENYWKGAAAEDLEYLKANKANYYAELVNIKAKCLEVLNAK